MTGRTPLRWGALVVGVMCALGGGAAEAGDLPPPSIDDEALDEIRELIPEGDPGEYDLDEADMLFGQLVELTGLSTEVDDFGSGSTLIGPCGGFAFSFDSDGRRIDAAVDGGDDGPPLDLLEGGQAFTSDNPFRVDTRGVVVYFGFSPRSGDGPMDHRWSIKTSGISLDSGGDPNTSGNNRNAGVVDLAEDLPVKFSAKVKVEGEMTAENLAPCVGKGHVEFIGNGLTDPVGLAGLALLGGGLFGILFNARPARTWKV
jgi:hypothetical protein